MIFARRLTPLLILALGWAVSCSPTVADEVIRIMAANISTGNQNYDNGEGNGIFQGLDPDIALVQELNYLRNSTTDIRDWVDMNFGSTFSYTREAGAGIPNAIVSRYPILAAGEWNDTELTDRDLFGRKSIFQATRISGPSACISKRHRERPMRPAGTVRRSRFSP